jgi:serine/threonine protein kinase
MTSEAGLGPQLAGERIDINSRTVQVVEQLGEGGFSFVYLANDESFTGGNVDSGIGNGGGGPASPRSSLAAAGKGDGSEEEQLVLKITSIHSREQRDIAEKEAKLLKQLSHPSIVRMLDSCYRSKPLPSTGGAPGGGRPQHLILMEYCEGGTALSVCNSLKQSGRRFDLPSLIIAFGQISNAVSYLHAQRPTIVHRDLKPVNFLVKNGAYKLCDFGSAVFGHVDLRTPTARADAEEVVHKTTTQMFRAPEMVDLYSNKKLTQATDVWALGCCLYSMAFFQNCFEEGSNLAILSRKYKIPDDNPYGDGLVELIDRMLAVDVKARADMTEVILCLSAIYSGRPLPPRKRVSKKKERDTNDGAGAYRTDGQGIHQPMAVELPKKSMEGKKLNPNSAAARRKRASATAKQSAGESAFASDMFLRGGGRSADPFGQPIGDKDASDPLSFSSMGAGGDLSNAFPAFTDLGMPSSGRGKFPIEDSFNANKSSFSTGDPFVSTLSERFLRQANVEDRSRERDQGGALGPDGRKIGKVKTGPFK